jgi:hypothetical protein
MFGEIPALIISDKSFPVFEASVASEDEITIVAMEEISHISGEI